jgi:hypothetical protein
MFEPLQSRLHNVESISALCSDWMEHGEAAALCATAIVPLATRVHCVVTIDALCRHWIESEELDIPLMHLLLDGDYAPSDPAPRCANVWPRQPRRWAAWSGLVSRKWLSLLIALARKTGQLRCSCCHKRLIRRLCGSGSSRHHPFTVKRCCRGSQLVLPHRHSSGRGHLDFSARPGIYQLWQMRANYVQITAPITSRQTLFVRRDCLVALWAPPSL